MGVAALPWKDILKGATLAVSLARDVMKHQKAKPKPPADAGSGADLDVAALAQRLEALETSSAEQAQVVKVLAEEVQVLARRAMVGYWLGVAGLVVAVIAVALAAIALAR
jgi:hypothetical protein